MIKHTFYPYRARPETIELRVEPQDPAAATLTDGRITCLDSQVQELDLDVSAMVPTEVLAHVLPVDELVQPPVEMRLVLQSLESRQRVSRRMSGRGGDYRTTQLLKRRDWYGSVQLQAFLVRANTNSTLPVPYARDRGAILASSPLITLLFDEPPAPPAGNLLDFRWENFAQSERADLKSQPESLYALDLLPDPPALYLNSGLLGATDTLNSGGTHGRDARIRDLTYNLITSQVYTSLLSTALVDLAVQAQAAVDDDFSPLAELGGWRQALIRDWAPRLYPELGRRAAIQQVCKDVRTSGWQPDLLLSRLPRAIQEENRTGHEFSRAATEVWS